MEEQTVTYGEPAKMAVNRFTREGYSFKQWNDKADGTGEPWTLPHGTWTYVDGDYGVKDGKLDVYAIWQPNKYTVTYDYATNGGSSASKTSASVEYNKAIDLSVTAEKSGWTFIGWNTNKDATTALSSLTMKASNIKLYAIFKKSSRTITITFNKNGASTQTNSSGTAVGDATVTRSCTIREVYNNGTQATTCNVTSPTIVGSTNTPTVIGYSTAASTHASSWNHNTSKAVSANATYYAQTTKAAKTITITFNKNGAASQTDANGTASTATTVTRACTIAATYNGVSQATTCSVTSPKIVASSNTPTITGYSTAAGTHSNSWSHSTAKSVSANATYYAQTKKAAITRSITYSKQGTGVSAIGKTSDSCSIAATYNGTTQGTACNVTLPSIIVSSGYTAGFWSTSNTATSGTSAGTSVSLSSNRTYYARANADKPKWSLVSVTPESKCLLSPPASSTRPPPPCIITAYVKGSGAGTLTDKLEKATLKVGSTSAVMVSPGGGTPVTSHYLSAFPIAATGAVVIVVPAGTLCNNLGVCNDETAITTGITLYQR